MQTEDKYKVLEFLVKELIGLKDVVKKHRKHSSDSESESDKSESNKYKRKHSKKDDQKKDKSLTPRKGSAKKS